MHHRWAVLLTLTGILVGWGMASGGAAAGDVPGSDPTEWASGIVPGAVDDTRTETPSTLQPDPMTASLIEQVDESTLHQYAAWLTGVETATIGGEPYVISTRNTASGTPIEKATQFAYEHLAGLGLDVTYHAWSTTHYAGRNVIGEMTGVTDPGAVLIISAHLDDNPAGPVAPGADDNASGSAAVLVAADILSQYDSSCTLEFALWTGEEQGLLGSSAWARWAKSHGINILGVLNLDMIGYNSDAEPIVDLHARSLLTQSVEIANLFSEVVETYDLGLAPEILLNDSTGSRSDNRSFWNLGYDAILAIEDHDDSTPYYHSTRDELSTLNLPFLTEFVKASVGTLANMAGCTILPKRGSLTGRVTTADGGTPIPNATIRMAGDDGTQFATTTGAGGGYNHLLPPGTYTVTAEALGYEPVAVSGVVVAAGAVTTRDLTMDLLPCLLLVDDDDNAPDVGPYYVAALDNLGYAYDLFETRGGDGPGRGGLEGYKVVLWFSGAATAAVAGPGSSDESCLASYLNGGGRLLLSSQDYLDGAGVSSFAASYLGIEGYTVDGGTASQLYGQAGDPIGNSLGPCPLDYPEGFDDHSDGLTAGEGSSVAFASAPSGGTPLVLDRDRGDWKTVFFGTPWTAVAHAGATNGEELLQRAIDWFGDCACQPVRISQTSVDADGCTATLSAQLVGSAPFAYQWDVGDTMASVAPALTVDFPHSGTYAYTLTVTNCAGVGMDTVSGLATVTCPWHLYLPAVAQGE